MSVLQRYAAMSTREWLQIVHVVSVLTVIEIGLRAGTLDRLARLVGMRLDGPPDAAGASEPQFTPGDRRALWNAQRVLRHWLFPSTCLRRSLLAGHLLRRWDPTLRVGVAKVDGIVTAHAWLEIGGFNLDPVGSAPFEVIAVSQHAGKGVR